MPAKKKDSAKVKPKAEKKKTAVKAKASSKTAPAKKAAAAKTKAVKKTEVKKTEVKKTVKAKTAPAKKAAAAKTKAVKKTEVKKTEVKKTVKARTAPSPKAAPQTEKKGAVKEFEVTPETKAPRPPAVKLTPKQEDLRKLLLARRKQIVEEAKAEIAKYIRGENRQLVESVLDGGDWSVIDLYEDVMFTKLNSHKEMLFKIDESLRKLVEGSYGICEDCGEDINPERLRVLPFAILCRDCQERKEMWEAMEKAVGV